MDYLGVPSSKNVFISSSFLKDVFTGYRILDWPSFLPTQPPVPGTLKMLGNFLLASMVSEEKLAVVQNIVYLHGFVIAVVLAAFKIFFFIFDFLYFGNEMPRCSFHLSCLVLSELPGPVV